MHQPDPAVSDYAVFSASQCFVQQFRNSYAIPFPLFYFIIAYQPEKVILPDYIKTKDYLLLISRIHKQDCEKRIDELIKLFGLEAIINKDLIKLSKGMRQKVLLIQTLMMEADAYFFDEPLSGLDPLSQQILVEEIIKLVSKDKLIIIVTHFIEQYRINNKKIVNLNNKEDYQNVTTPS